MGTQPLHEKDAHAFTAFTVHALLSPLLRVGWSIRCQADLHSVQRDDPPVALNLHCAGAMQHASSNGLVVAIVLEGFLFGKPRPWAAMTSTAAPGKRANNKDIVWLELTARDSNLHHGTPGTLIQVCCREPKWPMSAACNNRAQ